MVVKSYLNDGSVNTIVVSLRHGGNIIQSERAPQKGVGGRFSYQWKDLPNGEFQLSEHRWERFENREFGSPFRVYDLKVKDFHPRIELADSLFTEEALGISADAMVSNWVTGAYTPYRQNTNKSKEVTDSRLKELGDVLHSKGFVAPKNKK